MLNGVVPDAHVDNNWLLYAPLTWNMSYTYSSSFTLPRAPVGGPALLVFDGIKMGASVSLNGHALLDARNQFLRYTTVDVSSLLAGSHA